jgi:hypothetical protein
VTDADDASDDESNIDSGMIEEGMSNARRNADETKEDVEAATLVGGNETAATFEDEREDDDAEVVQLSEDKVSGAIASWLSEIS